MQKISPMNLVRVTRRIAAISIGILSVLILASCRGGENQPIPRATAQLAEDAIQTIQGVSGSTTVPGTSTGRAPILNISGAIPFQQSQLDAGGPIADIDKVVGVIKNQYWITNYNIQPDRILSELRKYPLLNVIAYRESAGGYLVELNLDNPSSVLQLQDARANNLLSVDVRDYVGKYVNTNF